MTTLARRNSSIHKIREYQLDKIRLEEQYEVVQALQEGWRGRLLLASSSRLDFFREFHYNYYLSPHLNILNAYDVAFETEDHYMFAQEYAPLGDLTTNLSDSGLGEIFTKRITRQLASALDFMHSKELVHRDLNMDNILVFKSDFSHVKVCDFGSTRKKGTLLKKRTVWLPYAPPEIVDAVQNEGFHADPAQDVWQLGILVYVLLTGQLPWQKADVTDPHYAEYLNWRKRRTLRTPKRFANFTSRLLRMLKRLLEPKPEKRAAAKEAYKYLEDRWLVRGGTRRDVGDIDGQSVCYSTFSAHSCPKEKDRVLGALKAHGIETTVDRVAKRQRIHEWLERSLGVPTVTGPRGETQPLTQALTQPHTHAHTHVTDPIATRRQYQEFAALAVKVAQSHGAKVPRDANHNTQAGTKRHSHPDREDREAREDREGREEDRNFLPLQRSRTDSFLLGGAPRRDHSRETSPDSDDTGGADTMESLKAPLRPPPPPPPR
ncbi:hypothetical protein O3P69_019585 [Scylla paramamosain]|uniref:Protein kinase domain-containing protein n=1 Tax=Scylla paramamosain TaxID=85552 RepID=A0AAW0SXU8_SCYPA